MIKINKFSCHKYKKHLRACITHLVINCHTFDIWFFVSNYLFVDTLRFNLFVFSNYLFGDTLRFNLFCRQQLPLWRYFEILIYLSTSTTCSVIVWDFNCRQQLLVWWYQRHIIPVWWYFEILIYLSTLTNCSVIVWDFNCRQQLLV